MDLLRAVAIVSVPVAAWLGRLGVAHLVLAALVISAASVVFDVGNSTLLPSIVTKEQLTRATASPRRPPPPPNWAARPWAGCSSTGRRRHRPDHRRRQLRRIRAVAADPAPAAPAR